MSISRLYDFTPNTTILSAEVDAELDQLVTEANRVAGQVNILALQAPPIGSIIPFYDFDGALTFDSNYWCYCDGTTKTVGGVSRVLPDLSNRYLVGFGTEGGADIGTAAWATAAVGNASHQIDLSGVGAAHTHGAGTLQFKVGQESSGEVISFYDASGNLSPSGSFQIRQDSRNNGTGGAFNAAWVYPVSDYLDFYTAAGAGSTASGGSAGSATQSIQPRSVRVRYLMRRA